jgi:hypothetical protein
VNRATSTTLLCLGSDGSGYPFDGAKVCAVCGIAFSDTPGRIPIHTVRERDEQPVELWN